MILTPLAMIGADRIQAMIHGVLSPFISHGAEGFDQVMKKQDTIHSQYEKAVELIGAQVSVENSQGMIVTGTVESVELNANGAVLQINGQKFNFAQLKQVLNTKNNGEKI